jgi:tRNA uridine 5-carboxymethylaminomethyl modification enzyme
MNLPPEGFRHERDSLDAMARFQGYIEREQAAVRKAAREERRVIPAAFSYQIVPGLSREMVDRLTEVRPETLGRASRVARRHACGRCRDCGLARQAFVVDPAR